MANMKYNISHQNYILNSEDRSGSQKNCILSSLASLWGRMRSFAVEIKVCVIVYVRVCTERIRGTTGNSSQEGNGGK